MQSKFMLEALKLAEQAGENGEIPVGAVIVKDNKIIAFGKNQREEKKNALSHAEIEAINNACKALGTWRLDGCEMYVTLEPCIMCMGAIINARLDTLVFGAYDTFKGFADSVISAKQCLKSDKPEIFGGIMEERCQKLLKDFFGSVRNNGNEETNNS
ncbi:MAG: nucleoside deaminase [Clostridia bacterium]|nr:nucleoside deaminase [Clostridia bacterium]